MEQSRLYLFCLAKGSSEKKHSLKICCRVKGIREIWAKEAFKCYLTPVYSTQLFQKLLPPLKNLSKKRRWQHDTVAVSRKDCLNLVTEGKSMRVHCSLTNWFISCRSEGANDFACFRCGVKCPHLCSVVLEWINVTAQPFSQCCHVDMFYTQLVI